MKLRLLAALLSLSLLLPAGAAEKDAAYEAELTRFLELQNVRQTFEKSMRVPWENLVTQGLITKEKLDAMSAEIVEVIYDPCVEAIRESYRGHFTLEELRQINAFYSTPVGQKMIVLAPELMMKGMESVQTPEMQGKIQAIVIKYLAK